MTMTIDRAKARGKRLRAALAEMNLTVSHGQALDLIARTEGLADWNVLSARLEPEVRIGPVPEGWTRAGDQPERFEMGAATRAGEPAAAIRLRPGEAEGAAFGTLMQKVRAEAYRGKRVALTGRLAADDVTGAVTIWLRADSAGKQNLAFDNLESAPQGEGPIRGDRDWVTRRIVLDIPEETATLNFGFYLRGGGTGWCGGLSLEVVDAETDVTASSGAELTAPKNLDFAG